LKRCRDATPDPESQYLSFPAKKARIASQQTLPAFPIYIDSESESISSIEDKNTEVLKKNDQKASFYIEIPLFSRSKLAYTIIDDEEDLQLKDSIIINNRKIPDIPQNWAKSQPNNHTS